MSSILGAAFFLATSTFSLFSPTPVIAQTLSLQDVASNVAIEYGVPTTTLSNLIQSESNWNPTASSPTGDYGLVQINLSYWGVTKAQAFDPMFALNFAAQKLANDQSYLWTACNCYSLVKTKIPGLPPMPQIYPNGSLRVGAVAIFLYRDRQTNELVKHIAYVKSVSHDTFYLIEANKDPCLIGSRTVSIYDPNLIGFWTSDGV